MAKQMSMGLPLTSRLTKRKSKNDQNKRNINPSIYWPCFVQFQWHWDQQHHHQWPKSSLVGIYPQQWFVLKRRSLMRMDRDRSLSLTGEESTKTVRSFDHCFVSGDVSHRTERIEDLQRRSWGAEESIRCTCAREIRGTQSRWKVNRKAWD